MKRMIVTGLLAMTAGFSGLMAQQPAQPAQKQGQAQAPAQPKGPAPKSKEEQDALMALFNAASAGNTPDVVIKSAEDLMTKFKDTDFKETALMLEANAYQQKGDTVNAQIFGDRVLEINPKNFQTTLMMGELLATHTRENDLDKEEKLTKAEKFLSSTVENLKTVAKPNPQLTDAQWEDGKKFYTAQAHSGLGVVALLRKKYDVAIAEFKQASDLDPQPAYSVRLASSYQAAGKNDEAIALCDKLLADPQLHPQIKQLAQNVKAAATQAQGKK